MVGSMSWRGQVVRACLPGDVCLGLPLHTPSPLLSLCRQSLTPRARSLVYMQYNATPLHYAKTAEMVKLLVDAKANVNAQDSVSVYAVVDVCESVCISV